MFRGSNTIVSILECDLYCCLSTPRQPLCTEIALSQQLERSTKCEVGKKIKGAVHTLRSKNSGLILFFWFFFSYRLSCLVALLRENREHLLLLFVGSESFVTSCLISSEYVSIGTLDQSCTEGRRGTWHGKLCIICISFPNLTIMKKNKCKI